jgi:hypothetical protein
MMAPIFPRDGATNILKPMHRESYVALDEWVVKESDKHLVRAKSNP